MNFKSMPLFTAVISMLIAGPAFANNNATATSSTTLVQPTVHSSVLSGFINLSRSTSLYDFQDGTRKDGIDYSGRLNANISKDYVVRLDGGYSQDLNYPDADDWSDTSISLRRNPFALGRTFLMGLSVSAVAPTSKDSYKRQNLLGSIGTAVSLSINPDRLIAGLGLVSSLSFARNFHQYDTDINGQVLNQYSCKQGLSVSYDFPIGISLSADFAHRNVWTYEGNLKEAFEISEELGYQMTEMLSVAVGHTNSGSALKPNGTDSNVQLTNDNTSLVYASATMIF